MATPAVAMVNSTETFGNSQTPNSPRIGFTDSAPPFTGIWYTGDRLENMAWAGTTVSPHAYVCLAGGAPGTWKAVSKA